MWRLLLVPWATIPAFPIWLLFVLPAWAFGWVRFQRVSYLGPALVFSVPVGRGPSRWRKRWGRYTGLSLPFAAFLSERLFVTEVDRVERHELCHNDQWLILGPLFPVVYLGLTILHGYHHNPLEIQARKAERV